MNYGNKKKWILYVSVLLAAIAAGLLVIGQMRSKQTRGVFEFAELKRGDLENIVDSTGTLSAVQTVEVGCQVSGIVKTLSADYNDVVKKDQILAELDRTPFEISVRDAEASVMRSKARMEQAQAEYQRNKPLFEKGYISETEYLNAKTTFETSQADLKQAGAALSKACINLDYTIIRSPIAGTVIERTVDPGQTMAAAFQAPKLFVIAQDLTNMQIEAAVDESDIGLIKEGQNARFTVQSYPDISFTGQVRQVRLQPTTTQNVVNYTVVIGAGNEKGLLLPGMTATVDFLVEEIKNALLVPNAALGYTPSTEILKQYGRQTTEKMQTQGSFPGVSADMTAKLPDNMGRVFMMNAEQNLVIVVFRKGASDGKMTEVLDDSTLKDNMRVIIGYSEQKNGQEKTGQPSFMPKPPGGGQGFGG